MYDLVIYSGCNRISSAHAYHLWDLIWLRFAISAIARMLFSHRSQRDVYAVWSLPTELIISPDS